MTQNRIGFRMNPDLAWSSERVVKDVESQPGPYSFFPVSIPRSDDPLKVGSDLAEQGHRALTELGHDLRPGEHITTSNGVEVIKIVNGTYHVQRDDGRFGVNLIYGGIDSDSHLHDFSFHRDELGL